MTKMSQVRSVYPVNYDECSDKEAENGEDAEARNELDAEMDHGSGGETMDEEDAGRTQFDQLFDANSSGAKPVVFDGKKKKDKSIKCRKCFKGGHEDVHCPIQVDEKFSCHICEAEDPDHETLCCPFIDNKCKTCLQTGHTAEMCRLGSIQQQIVKSRPWYQREVWPGNEMKHSDNDEYHQHPTVTYPRIMCSADSVLEFNYDRVINTDLRKLLKVTQEQKWLGVVEAKK